MFLKENSVQGRTLAPAFLHIPCMHFIYPVEYLVQYAIEYFIEYHILYIRVYVWKIKRSPGSENSPITLQLIE